MTNKEKTDAGLDAKVDQTTVLIGRIEYCTNLEDYEDKNEGPKYNGRLYGNGKLLAIHHEPRDEGSWVARRIKEDIARLHPGKDISDSIKNLLLHFIELPKKYMDYINAITNEFPIVVKCFVCGHSGDCLKEDFKGRKDVVIYPGYKDACLCPYTIQPIVEAVLGIERPDKSKGHSVADGMLNSLDLIVPLKEITEPAKGIGLYDRRAV